MFFLAAAAVVLPLVLLALVFVLVLVLVVFFLFGMGVLPSMKGLRGGGGRRPLPLLDGMGVPSRRLPHIGSLFINIRSLLLVSRSLSA